MELISTNGGVNFVLYKTFNSSLFLPIANYVNWKLQHDWDDYNELYHAIQYIEKIKRIDDVWFEVHTLEKKGEIRGVLTIVGGAIAQLEGGAFDPEKTVLLKYFHIVEKGKGYGSHWLNKVVMPYYSERGILDIIVTSSHPKSFNFYGKIGVEIRKYSKKSDNELYDRLGKAFLVPIKAQPRFEDESKQA